MIDSSLKKTFHRYPNSYLFFPFSLFYCFNFCILHLAKSTFAYPNPFTSNKSYPTYGTIETSLKSISNNIDPSFILPKAIIQNSENTQQNTMKAWRCSGRSNHELIDHLIMAGIVKTKAVQEALLRVDRANYVINKEKAYIDAPQSIGLGQTISAPHMHAHVLEELLPTLVVQQQQKQLKDLKNSNLKILDVGSGSGYLSSCFGRLVQQNPMNSLQLKGNVYAIEIIPTLLQMSQKNVQKADNDLLQKTQISTDTSTINNDWDPPILTFQKGNGWKGLPSHAPYDVIHVGAAAEDFPIALMMQLAVGGRMVCPVGPDGGTQILYRIDRIKQSLAYSNSTDTSKSNDEDHSTHLYDQSDFEFHQLLQVRYVPLVRY